MSVEYECPVCGVHDENAYLRCNRPDCTDGRDPRPSRPYRYEEAVKHVGPGPDIATLTATNAELREQVGRLERELDVAVTALVLNHERAEAAERAAVKGLVDGSAIGDQLRAAVHGEIASLRQALSPAESEPEQEAGARPRLLDLSNLLRHAFISGRESFGASSFHAEAWVKYDPEQCPAYARISAAVTAAMEAKR